MPAALLGEIEEQLLTDQRRLGSINTDKKAWQTLVLPAFTSQEAGYLQVFVANESNGQAQVWFDELEITYQQAMPVQENHYSPWGLNLAGIEQQGSPDHKFQYNGKQKQEELRA